MPVHMITLTDDQETAFAAKVAWLEEQSNMVPPVFPPVEAVADVDALLEKHLAPIIQMEVQWYLQQ